MMKTLLLTRHGKTVRGDAQLKDFDRYLAPRGQADIKLVARELQDLEYEPDLIISSPAVRAKQTADLFAKFLDYPAGYIKYLDFLYGYYSADQLIAEVNHLGHKARSVMIVAHNPSIAELGAYFTASFYDHMPTSATLVVDFEVKRWEYISEGSGILSQFIFPSALRE